MSQFFEHQPTSVEPMPNVTQQGSVTPDFGSYGTARDCNLSQGTASAATNRAQTFGAGIDDNLHSSQSLAFIGFPLTAGSDSIGTFQTDVWADVSAVPLGGLITLSSALFKWLANDTLSGQLGVTATTGGNLTTVVTQYTLIFGAGLSTSYADGDRFYIEYWFNTKDSVTLGDGGLYTFRIRYDSATRPSSFTVTGTQAQLSTGHFLSTLDVGT